MNSQELERLYDRVFGEPYTKVEGFPIDSHAAFTAWYIPASFFLEAGAETQIQFKTYFRRDLHRFLNIRLRYLFQIFDRFNIGLQKFRLPVNGLDVGHRGYPEGCYEYEVEKNEFGDVWITLVRNGWVAPVQQLGLNSTEFLYVQEKLELLRRELGL